MIAVALALLGCSFPGAKPAEDAGPLVLRVFLDGAPKSGGGTLVVQAEYDGDGKLSLPEPEGAQPGDDSPKLDFTADGPPVQERVGDRDVVTRRYVFKGPSGSYEVPPLEATWTGADGNEVTAHSSAVFVDLDAKPPREGEIADIVEPGAVTRWPWLLLGGVGTLFVAGVGFAFRPRRPVVQVGAAPRPPHLAAIAAWEKVRDDGALTIDDKAREVSRIFREYTEAVLGFEATSRTTFELIEHLTSLRHLPEGNVPRARRILRAADRVKFAEERPDRDGRTGVQDWLLELDADLRAFVDATTIRTGGRGDVR